MSDMPSSFSFDGSASSSNNMTTTTQGSSGSSFDSSSAAEHGPLVTTKTSTSNKKQTTISKRSQHPKRKRSKKNGHNKHKTKKTVEDEIGESIAHLLNENPDFEYSRSRRQEPESQTSGRKRGRNDGDLFDWEDASLSTFQPLFGPQNRYRMQVLTKCCWILIQNFRPHRDIPDILCKLQDYFFQPLDNQNRFNEPPLYQALRFFAIVFSLVFLGCLSLASGAAFTAVYALNFCRVVCLFGSSLFVDWNEIAGVCPQWMLECFRTIRWFFVQFDRVVLFGNRWRGREWNKNGFDFTDSIHKNAHNQPQSSVRDQYLWKLPPPEALTRSSKMKPTNDAITPRNSNTAASIRKSKPEQEGVTSAVEKEDEWSDRTAQHIEAIDYCYIMLREEFIETQYTKLKKKKSSYELSMNSVGGEDAILQDPIHDVRRRASNVSTIENFRQEFVHDPSTNNMDPDEIDEVTGVSTKLQEMLQSDDSFDDVDSNAAADAQNTTLDSIKAICNDGDDTVGSVSDGTSIDMNWMDVGTEIGLKLLGSSAVQKAMVSDDTVQKISNLKDKMDSHFKKDYSNKNSVALDVSAVDSDGWPMSQFFDAEGERTEANCFASPRANGERNALHVENGHGYALPVHPMWTSAAAAVSPTHSFATTETFGTKDDSTLASPVGAISSPLKSGQSSLASSPIKSAVPPLARERPSQDIEREDIQLPKIDIVAVSPTPRNGNKKPKSKFVENLPLLPKIPAAMMSKKRRKRKPDSIIDPAIEIVCKDEGRQNLIPQLAPPSTKSRRPMLLPGVKIAVPLFPITPDDPKRRSSSRKRRKERYQMATVVSCKRICVFEKNNMPQSGNRGTNCLAITVNLDKCFLRNGQFATMTLRIMDDWGPKYMPKHSKLPMGSCVATTFGLGVLVGWRVEDDMHIVRSLWQRRGPGSACGYFRRDSIHATMEAAVGFEANTTHGRGTVIGYVNGGPDFKTGRYLVDVPEFGSKKTQLMELIRSDVLSCESAKFIPIVEHIRAAAQYQLQIDRYEELRDASASDEDPTTKMLGEFSKHFDILWKSFLKAIKEDHEFDDGMNEFFQKCVNFLNQLDSPGDGATPDSQNNNGADIDGFDASIVIHSVDSNVSQHSISADSVTSPNGGEKSDSGFWLMNNMFDLFNSDRDANRTQGDDPAAEGIEIQCTPRHRKRSEKNYARAFAILRTLTRTVTNAQAASADEPSFKIALAVCHEFLVFIRTVIMVQKTNMNHESLEIWRAAWIEIVSVFGPVQQRIKKIGQGIAERIEKHGRKAKARLLRFVDIIVQDDVLFSALEQGDWTRCAQHFEVAIVQAKIIDEQSREHYRKTAQFLYNHFSSATSKSDGAAARNNEKAEKFLKAVQVFANPRKAILELFLQDSVLEMMERIFVRAFSKDEVASRMLNIHCSNFQSLRRFRMLKDFTIAGKLWIPLLDAADEEFSWAVSKLPVNAQEYLSPISSLFSLCVVQFHKMDEGDLTKDWLNFLMEEEAANIIHDLDMKLILALEQFSRDVKDTMVVLPYYPSIDDDILNLVDDFNVDVFVKEASGALDDEAKLREFIKEKATIMVERFLDYLPKIAIPVEKRDLGEGWTLTCRGAGGGDLTLSELVIKRENLTCQVLGGDSLLFPAASAGVVATANLEELDIVPTIADASAEFLRNNNGNGNNSPLSLSNPTSPITSIEETSVLTIIKKIITNAIKDGCYHTTISGGSGDYHPPTDKYAASVLGNLPVSAVLNCAIDLWRNLEIDDDELLEVAIRDVAYQIEQVTTNTTSTSDSSSGNAGSGENQQGSNRHHPDEYRTTTTTAENGMLVPMAHDPVESSSASASSSPLASPPLLAELDSTWNLSSKTSGSFFSTKEEVGVGVVAACTSGAPGSSSKQRQPQPPQEQQRFNPRVDPTVLFLEIKKLTFNLENFLFRIEKHESKKTIFDPAFEGKGSILIKNVKIKLRVQCFKGYVLVNNAKSNPNKQKQQHKQHKKQKQQTQQQQIPVPILQLTDLDVSLEKVKLFVKDTGADWLLNKIVEGFGDKFTEIVSANLCEQVRKQAEEGLQNLNGYFEENPEVLLGFLDISLDDLDELTVFV